VVANRFFLWGTANISTVVIFLASSLITGGEDQVLSGGMILTISSLTLLTAVTQWLAFFPPSRYRAWVCGMAGSPRAPASA
jgi:hypothetical protein